MCHASTSKDILDGSRYNLVAMMFTLRAGWSSYRASIPAPGKIFFFSSKVQTGCGAHFASYLMRTVAPLLGVKWQERDTYLTLPRLSQEKLCSWHKIPYEEQVNLKEVTASI